jgi:hypothetical protein
MNQMVIVCTSGTRPSPPQHGMVIYETDTAFFRYCSEVTGPNWARWKGGLTYVTATSAQSTTTTTFVKDSGIGDLVFVADNANTPHRIRYIARAISDAANTTMDYRLYDGGVSSPTTSSTLIGGASVVLYAVSVSTQLVCEVIQTFSAGTHTVAAFYGRTSGTGNVNPTTGQRILSIEALT